MLEAVHLTASGFTLRARCVSEGVPFASCFANLVQWVATPHGAHSCRLLVTRECRFISGAGILHHRDCRRGLVLFAKQCGVRDHAQRRDRCFLQRVLGERFQFLRGPALISLQGPHLCPLEHRLP